MPRYDGVRFTPPAPVANVSLVDVDSGQIVDGVPMLLDTGADVTLVPRPAVDALRAALLPKTYVLEGFDGRQSQANAVRLGLRFLGRRFRGQFLVIDQPVGVLGRNVLNHVVLMLNGPSQTWREHPAGGGRRNG